MSCNRRGWLSIVALLGVSAALGASADPTDERSADEKGIELLQAAEANPTGASDATDLQQAADPVSVGSRP